MDSQNQPATGRKQHVLHLELPAFQGTGTYALAAPGTFYQVSVFNSEKRLDSPQTFYPFPHRARGLPSRNGMPLAGTCRALFLQN
ncbi:hypothetical protein ACFQT0_18565 [Hymenobacter humi]|uniref:Uncharacterized protein n=1 Tax=Hymenobacter humi TaxID=1411620 RepID=A0ABW2U7Q7_9BACT